MKFTNTENLPKSLVNLLTRDLHVKSGKYSVTEIIGPPRISQLRRRHGEKITADVLDRIWLLFGTLAHTQLEATADRNSLAEEHMVINVDGVPVSGTADLYEDGNLYDYKTTSVYAVKDGIKPEWEAQLNVYRVMYAEHGFDVKSLKIVAILRDWSKNRATKSDLPKTPVVLLAVPVWDIERTKKYLKDRVLLHEEACVKTDDDLPECSADERWESPERWAVMKKGRKTAIKLFCSETSADAVACAAPDCYVEHRPSISKRCAEYCEVRNFCNQWKKEQEINNED